MLRSRLKVGDTPKQQSGSGIMTNFQAENKNPSDHLGFLTTTRKLGLAAVLVLFILNIKWRLHDESKTEHVVHRMAQKAIDGKGFRLNKSIGVKGNSVSTWTYPLVDMAMLQKLDQMQELFAQDHSVQDYAPPADSGSRRRPLVMSIPEGFRQPNLEVHATICESVVHPRPCRFLLPLRVAEQESKARIHFSQIAHLAKLLNRTLVLPNVGKSKIGACHKWSFDTYYELDDLSGSGGTNHDSLVSMSDFKVWLEGRNQPQHISSQLVSTTPSLPLQIGSKGAIYSDNGISIHKVDLHEDWRSEFPGCLLSKFQSLAFEEQHIFVSVDNSADRTSFEPVGLSIAHALSSALSKDPSSEEAQVLLLNWDLRHPVFPTLPQLTYSRKMVDIANQLAPTNPYLVVHWRMETIDPAVLADCVTALVDVLSSLLHDESVAHNVSTVWFASDYPYPIARRTDTQPRPALVAKSGTFRDFEIRHEEAVEILRKAFDQHNDLEGWKLTDIAEALENQRMETELLHDSGVLAILDKMISTKANLFVSGSKRCGRTR